MRTRNSRIYNVFRALPQSEHPANGCGTLQEFAAPRGQNAGKLFLAALVLAISAIMADGAHAAVGGPNVLLIIADDLGTADATPNIDAIADGGARLTNFYANPFCSPTRAAMITGSYSERVGINSALSWNTTTGLPASQRTLPKVMSDTGRDTALVGKWHLGRLPQFGPLNHYGAFRAGVLSGAIDQFTHVNTGTTNVDWWDGTVRNFSREYSTTAITREGIRFMNEHDAGPWFLTVAYTAVHSPHQAPDGSVSYAGQLRALDNGVADLIDHAPANTIIWFVGDNGGVSGSGGHNLPLKGGKGGLYQGGIRVPSWVRWDGHIPPSTLARVGHVMDILPTLAELVGTTPGRPIDGVSLVSEITGGPWGATRDLKFSTGNNFANIEMPWKLALFSGRAELYNLKSDPNEHNNIARSNAGKVASMRAAITGWRHEVGR